MDTAGVNGSGGAKALPKTVAVIDRDEDMRLLVRLILRRDARLQVVVDSASADDALSRLGGVEPSLFVVDRTANATAVRAAVPGAVILRFSTEQDDGAWRRQGIDGVLGKQHSDRLLRAVQQLLGLPHLDGEGPRRD
jgi:hypothetical protein